MIHWIEIQFKKLRWRQAQRELAAVWEAWDESDCAKGREAVDSAKAELHRAYEDYTRSLEVIPGEPGSTWD